MTTQAKRNEECLVLEIAVKTVGDRETVVELVCQELTALEARSITKVQIRATQENQKFFLWEAEFDLEYPQPLPKLDLSLALEDEDEEPKDGLHQTGDVIRDRYRILEVLGQGGNGITYAAEDLQQHTKVAIKALSLRHMDDWKQIELFEREAKVLSQLDHPAIPKYFDYFTIDTDEDRAFYIVQELAQGQNLAKLVEAGWRTNEKGVRKIIEQVLNILIYLHGLKPPVVHRDIKPHNLIYSNDGKVSLVDFGAVQDTYRSTMARGSTVIGTFGYMAPEQFRGQAVPATDLYALGATILFILTHRSPSELPQERLRYNFRSKIQVSEQFADWLQKMVEPEIETRFASARESLVALQKKQIVWLPQRNLSWQAWLAIASISSILTVCTITNKWLILSFYDIYPEICKTNKKDKNPEDIKELIDYVTQNKRLSNKFPNQDTEGDRCVTANLNIETLNFLSQHGNRLDYQALLLSTKSEEVIDWLMSKKVDINSKDKSNKTALSIAVLNYLYHDGNINIIKKLIKNGADINNQDNLGLTPLHYAVTKEDNYEEHIIQEQNGHEEEYLVTRKNGREEYTLVKGDKRYMINNEDTPIIPKSSNLVIFLIQSGSKINIKDINGATPLHYSIIDLIGKSQFQCLLSRKSYKCIQTKETNEQMFIQTNPMFGKTNKTILLINNGADVNSKDNNGNTPLDYCFQYISLLESYIKYSKRYKEEYKRHIQDSWQMSIIYYLVGKGANINNTSHQDIQIYFSHSIYNKDFNFAKLLISKGANVNITGSDSHTYLHYASSIGDMQIVRLLIDNNADVNIINNNGKTALSLSANNEIAQLLIAKGAK
ncbi:protein kinase domain-containing protein [Pseudanabaena yagii]|uniref:protein kinase domain-containing protein n=1 Tax=Pseudanabaena yagii TaxID=2661615 RepID=UPI001CEC0B59|nr:ankyrin repeat domain-containing protein [Pseudanabaena yagii]